MNRCPKGQILRKGYIRKAYVRSDGTFVKQTIIPPTCGEDIIGPLKKGTLSQYGYSTSKTALQRHQALDKAITKINQGTVCKKLNAVYILSRNTNPRVAKIYKSDYNYVKSKFTCKFT